jgi:hypothetical protein
MPTLGTQAEDDKNALVRSAASALAIMTELGQKSELGESKYDRTSMELLTQVAQMCEFLKAKIGHAIDRANIDVEINKLDGTSCVPTHSPTNIANAFDRSLIYV